MTHDNDSDDGDTDNDNNRIVTTQIISGTVVVVISPTLSLVTVTMTLSELDVLHLFSTVRQVQPNSDESFEVVSSLATMSSSEAELTIPLDVNTRRVRCSRPKHSCSKCKRKTQAQAKGHSACRKRHVPD